VSGPNPLLREVTDPAVSSPFVPGFRGGGFEDSKCCRRLEHCICRIEDDRAAGWYRGVIGYSRARRGACVVHLEHQRFTISALALGAENERVAADDATRLPICRKARGYLRGNRSSAVPKKIDAVVHFPAAFVSGPTTVVRALLASSAAEQLVFCPARAGANRCTPRGGSTTKKHQLLSSGGRGARSRFLVAGMRCGPRGSR